MDSPSRRRHLLLKQVWSFPPLSLSPTTHPPPRFHLNVRARTRLCVSSRACMRLRFTASRHCGGGLGSSRRPQWEENTRRSSPQESDAASGTRSRSWCPSRFDPGLDFLLSRSPARQPRGVHPEREESALQHRVHVCMRVRACVCFTCEEALRLP